MQTTSFDSPRTVPHHNLFTSFHDTTDDPLATTSATSIFDSSAARNYNHASSSSAGDPWSSYYNPTVNSTVNGSSSKGSALTALSSVIDEETVPDLYKETWSVVSSSSSATGSTFAAGSTISLSVLQKTLSSAAGLSAGEIEKIVNLVSSSGSSLAASYTATSPVRTSTGGTARVHKLEFYVAIALAALAQNKEPISLKHVTARKANLPTPRLDLSDMQSGQVHRPANPRNPSSTPSTPYRAHKMSLGSSSDPWNTSNIHQRTSGPHDSTTSNGDPFISSNVQSSINGEPPTYSPPRHHQQRQSAGNVYSSFPTYIEQEETQSGPSAAYGGYDASASGGGDTSNSALLSLPPFTSSSNIVSSWERIQVLQQSELAGNYFTRHTVYRVVSEKRKSAVLRRYSDWVWLNECLEKKYSARMKFSLPPKRMGISARHVQVASDEQFLERRRRGLFRYIEFIANHPILRHERLVNVFLNDTVDLTTWRKQHASELSELLGSNSNSIDEAANMGKLSSSQESLIPTSFDSIVATLREALPGLIDALTRACALLERINHRSEQNAGDLLRVRLAFDSFGEIYAGLNGGQHAGRPREIEEETVILNRDLKTFSKGLGDVAESDENHVALSANETLEKDLKTQREIWKSLLQLVNVYETKLRHDTVDKTKKRIESSQAKYTSLNQSTANIAENKRSAHLQEMGKMIASIEADQASIARMLDRRAFNRWAITAEIRTAWRYSLMNRVQLGEWSTREHRHASHLERVWSTLEAATATT